MTRWFRGFLTGECEKMRKFLTLTGISIQKLMYYKTSFLLNLITPFVELAGQFLLWNALYGLQGGSPIGGMARREMLTYIPVAFALNNLLSWTTENALSREIRNGTVVARCIRPVSFICQAVAEMSGAAIVQGAVNFSVVAVLFAFFHKSFVFPGPGAAAVFVPCMLLSVLLRILVIEVFSLLCFFTTGHLGISWTRNALCNFFSGALIPVSLFPGWLARLTYMTPFPYMVQIPVAVLLGRELPAGLFWTFFLQILWIGIFLLLHFCIFRRIRRNMNIAGG